MNYKKRMYKKRTYKKRTYKKRTDPFIIRQVNLPQKVPKQENFHGSLQKPQAESEE